MSLVDCGLFLYPPYLSTVSTSGFLLDAAEELITFIVQAPKTGILKKIGWRLYAASSPDLTCRVSIETVAASLGAPVATTDTAKTLYATGAVSADITNPSVGVRFDAINGSSGISVTKGDLLAITIRIISYTSGSISVHYNQYGGIVGLGGIYASAIHHGYTMTYAASTWARYNTPFITLEYDGEFVPTPFTTPAQPTYSYHIYNSSSSPDRRGMKIMFPLSCTAKGFFIYTDLDSDTDLIIYDSDGYTVMSGFPITIYTDKRALNTTGWYFIEFPVEPQFTADSEYRIVLLPKSTSNITFHYCVPTDDGSILGINAYPEGNRACVTSFSGTPTSESHEWTDAETDKLVGAFLINKINISSGSGGGLLTHPGMNGGCNA